MISDKLKMPKPKGEYGVGPGGVPLSEEEIAKRKKKKKDEELDSKEENLDVEILVPMG